jgi:NADPH:quinone reductase-like Zn-dependent oxidoreductase
MKAVLIRAHGGLDSLEVADLPKPEPGPGQVLLHVKAAAMNHLDSWVRRGMPGMKLPLPMVPGSDAAGVIAEVGAGVHAPAKGTRVFVSPGYCCGWCPACLAGQDPLCRDYGIIGEHSSGTMAEYVALPSLNVMPLPEGLSFEEGAAFPLVTLTAWHMLVTRAGVKAGETVLVQAGGSGVGTAAIQIARLHGARVFTTVGSKDKAVKARELGADEAIDYKTHDFREEVRRLTGKRGVDVVVETVGQETWDASLKSLAKGGRLVTCGATSGHQGMTDIRYVFSRGLSILGSTMGSRNELLTVAKLVGEKRLRPVIDRVLPLEKIAEGHRAMAERSAFGKIVIRP